VILVDTSVWVDHLRAGDKTLSRLLNAALVLSHPFVVGELAMGNLRQRETVLNALADLPCVVVASHSEVLDFINSHALFGRGIGYVDAHLLAGVRLTAGATLWTHDRRLHDLAIELRLAFSQQHGGCQPCAHHRTAVARGPEPRRAQIAIA
jgi:predicted nucleic acid-binding protein